MMTLRESELLRQLVADYYHGLTTQESYRQKRAQLLDNIGAEIAEQPHEISERQTPSSAKVPPTSAAVSKDTKQAQSSFGPKKVAMSVIAVVGIAAIAYVAVTQMSGSGTAPDPYTEPSAAVSDGGLEGGDALIEEFLVRNDWTDDSLSNFLLAWEALDEGQRQLATEGRRYRRLTTSLHQRIREEAALSDSAKSDRLGSLADFAATMGAPYRLSRAEEPDQGAKPRVVPSAEVRRKPPLVVTDTDDADAEAVTNVDAAIKSTPPTAPTEERADEPAEDVIEDVIEDVTEDVIANAGDVIPNSADAIPDSKEQSGAESSAVPETAGSVDDPCPAEIAGTRRPYCQDSLADGSAGPPLVVLPTGAFEMGSDAIESEAPLHPVTIAHHIAMSLYEVTAQEYAKFCDATSLPCTDASGDGDFPVVSVSWDDAVMYTEWLSESTGFQYRLPSEAEWEFAARAGTRSPYFFGDDITPSAAHSSANGTVDAPLPRTDRKINRNPFRLYHMSGNVREWTQDAWYPNYVNAPADGSARASQTEVLRVIRGGSYADPGAKLRSAAREPLDRSHRDALTGFRVVREVSSSSR